MTAFARRHRLISSIVMLVSQFALHLLVIQITSSSITANPELVAAPAMGTLIAGAGALATVLVISQFGPAVWGRRTRSEIPERMKEPWTGRAVLFAILSGLICLGAGLIEGSAPTAFVGLTVTILVVLHSANMMGEKDGLDRFADWQRQNRKTK